jgi:hypothetical protein
MSDKIKKVIFRGDPDFVEPMTPTQQNARDIKELKERVAALEFEIKLLKMKKKE